MRLINTDTLVIHEFLESESPIYAILSHTWGPEEVTFQDWLYVTKQNPARWGWVYVDEEVRKIKARTGYVKITAACSQARKDCLHWIWVDTNCIDKTNSAELSEAINSMFRWYKHAWCCYVFLADVSSSSIEECKKSDSEFRNSRWFKRGWTLQELIAPQALVFYSNQWTRICRRKQIAAELQEITRVSQDILTARSLLDEGKNRPSTAEIMSWAAGRETTRIEDTAYCLLGLFDINMPLLYGEGSKALQRLQLEILQRTTDLSLFAWQHVPSFQEISITSWTPFLPTLAQSPDLFSEASHAGYKTDSWAPINLEVTNLGLSLRLPLIETLDPNLTFAVLIPLSQTGRAVWMPLWKSGHRYIRVGFISATAIVPHCPFDIEAKDIILSLHDKFANDGLNDICLEPPRCVTSSNVLLTFPHGLHNYRVVDKIPASDKYWSPTVAGHLQWDDLLLALVISKEDPSFVYGAIEFELTIVDPSRERVTVPGRRLQRVATVDPTGERVAILFIAQLNEVCKPTSWTCVDISHKTLSKYSLETRAKVGLRNAKDLTASKWKQDCLLTASFKQPGLVIMDDLQRDLSTPEFGGYGENTATASHDIGRRVPRGYYPVLAQVVLPMHNKSR